MAEREPLLAMLTLADLLSLANGFLGLLAIIAAFQGQTRAVFAFLLFAIMFDGVDGALTRLGHGGGRLGAKLDTLSDTVSFVVAPALLFWVKYGSTFTPPFVPDAYAPYVGRFIVLAACTVYFAAGVLRLARFDYLQGGAQHDYFVGVTTPGAAAVIVAAATIPWQPLPAVFVLLALAVLMTSRVRLPKVRGSLAPASGFVLLSAAALGLAGLDLGPLLVLVAFLGYLVMGPGYVRRHSDESDLEEEPQPLV